MSLQDEMFDSLIKPFLGEFDIDFVGGSRMDGVVITDVLLTVEGPPMFLIDKNGGRINYKNVLRTTPIINVTEDGTN